jgi:hypothetical protein
MPAGRLQSGFSTMAPQRGRQETRQSRQRGDRLLSLHRLLHRPLVGSRELGLSPDAPSESRKLGDRPLRLRGFLCRPRLGGGEATLQELEPVLQDLVLGREGLEAGFEDVQTREIVHADGFGAGRKCGPSDLQSGHGGGGLRADDGIEKHRLNRMSVVMPARATRRDLA